MTPYEEKFLYIDHTDGFYKYIDSPSDADIKTRFKRKITIDRSGDIMNVKVEIFWPNDSFSVQEKLYNWK